MDREQPPEKFPQSVVERIGFYVYALRDPRDRSVFYIGKGTGNRVFQHAAAAVASPLPSDKLDRIRAIQSKDLDVVYEIIRHGMDEKEALAVESALIDWNEGLTNKVKLHPSTSTTAIAHGTASFATTRGGSNKVSGRKERINNHVHWQ